MQWIKPFVGAVVKIYAGNSIDAFQPIDFFHFYPLWYDLWIHRTYEVLEKLNISEKHYADFNDILPVPSSMRAIIQKIVPSYRGFSTKNNIEVGVVCDFFARMLNEACPNDPFGDHSTPLHTSNELSEILGKTEWQNANPAVAKKLGMLIASAGSLVHGQYNDLVTDFGWDAYGPYEINYEDSKHTLLIRHFPDLSPSDLWDSPYLASVRDVKIFAIYKDVEWEIASVGCHTIIKSGNQITGLRAYCVLVDGRPASEKEIDGLIQELAKKAEAIYREIRKMNFEELKSMVLLQECYQLKGLFQKAGMDWRPTQEMQMRIQGRDLLKGLVPFGVLLDTEEKCIDAMGVRDFAKEIYGQDI